MILVSIIDGTVCRVASSFNFRPVFDAVHVGKTKFARINIFDRAEVPVDIVEPVVVDVLPHAVFKGSLAVFLWEVPSGDTETEVVGYC